MYKYLTEIPCINLTSSSETLRPNQKKSTQPTENEPSTSQHLSSNNQASTSNAAIQIKPVETQTKTPVPVAVASTSGLGNQKPSKKVVKDDGKQSATSSKSDEPRAIASGDAGKLVAPITEAPTHLRSATPTSAKRPIDGSDISSNKQKSKRQKTDEPAGVKLNTTPAFSPRTRARNQLPHDNKQRITQFFRLDKMCKICSTSVHSRAEYEFHSNVHTNLKCPVCCKRFKGNTHEVMVNDHLRTCFRIQQQAPKQNLKKLYRGRWKVLVQNMSMDEMAEAMQSKCDASKIVAQEASPNVKSDDKISERRDKTKKTQRNDANNESNEQTAKVRDPFKKPKVTTRPGKIY